MTRLSCKLLLVQLQALIYVSHTQFAQSDPSVHEVGLLLKIDHKLETRFRRCLNPSYRIELANRFEALQYHTWTSVNNVEACASWCLGDSKCRVASYLPASGPRSTNICFLSSDTMSCNLSSPITLTTTGYKPVFLTCLNCVAGGIITESTPDVNIKIEDTDTVTTESTFAPPISLTNAPFASTVAAVATTVSLRSCGGTIWYQVKAAIPKLTLRLTSHVQVASTQECASLCYHDPGCHSAGYLPDIATTIGRTCFLSMSMSSDACDADYISASAAPDIPIFIDCISCDSEIIKMNPASQAVQTPTALVTTTTAAVTLPLARICSSPALLYRMRAFKSAELKQQNYYRVTAAASVRNCAEKCYGDALCSSAGFTSTAIFKLGGLCLLSTTDMDCSTDAIFDLATATDNVVIGCLSCDNSTTPITTLTATSATTTTTTPTTSPTTTSPAPTTTTSTTSSTTTSPTTTTTTPTTTSTTTSPTTTTTTPTTTSTTTSPTTTTTTPTTTSTTASPTTTTTTPTTTSTTTSPTTTTATPTTTSTTTSPTTTTATPTTTSTTTSPTTTTTTPTTTSTTTSSTTTTTTPTTTSTTTSVVIVFPESVGTAEPSPVIAPLPNTAIPSHVTGQPGPIAIATTPIVTVSPLTVGPTTQPTRNTLAPSVFTRSPGPIATAISRVSSVTDPTTTVGVSSLPVLPKSGREESKLKFRQVSMPIDGMVGFYRHFTVQSALQCAQYCFNDQECYAAGFIPNDSNSFMCLLSKYEVGCPTFEALENELNVNFRSGMLVCIGDGDVTKPAMANHIDDVTDVKTVNSVAELANKDTNKISEALDATEGFFYQIQKAYDEYQCAYLCYSSSDCMSAAFFDTITDNSDNCFFSHETLPCHATIPEGLKIRHDVVLIRIQCGDDALLPIAATTGQGPQLTPCLGELTFMVDQRSRTGALTGFFRRSSVGSAMDCARECVENAYCESAGYIPSTDDRPQAQCFLSLAKWQCSGKDYSEAIDVISLNVPLKLTCLSCQT